MAYPLGGKLIDDIEIGNIGVVTVGGISDVESVPSGNFVLIEGLNKVKGPATLVTSVSSCPLLLQIKQAEPLVFQVTTKNEKQKPRLHDGKNKEFFLVQYV